MVPEGSRRLFLFPFGGGLTRLWTWSYTHLFLTVEEEMCWFFFLAFSSVDLESI